MTNILNIYNPFFLFSIIIEKVNRKGKANANFTRKEILNMKIVGMNHSTNADGQKTTKIHGAEEFNFYYTNTESGRGCIDMKVDSIYVGTFDCPGFKVGMEIEILYDKAITTTKGTFQTIKRIDVVTKG